MVVRVVRGISSVRRRVMRSEVRTGEIILFSLHKIRTSMVHLVMVMILLLLLLLLGMMM